VSVRTQILTDSEHTRLLRENPHLRASYNDWCPTCGKNNGPGKPGTYFWKGQTHECDCEAQLRLHMLYLHAGIGTTYQRLSWEDYDGTSSVEGIIKYVDAHKAYIQRGMGLFFTGPFGSGKTMLANLALKDFVRLGYHCYATTFASTIEMFTAGWKSAEEQRHFQDRFVGSEILLLDDVGRELLGSTKLSVTTFDNILRSRVQYGRPTFITTNLDSDEVETGYGSAVLSLLREKSIVLPFDGEDFRNKANQRERDEIKRGEVRPIQ